MSAPKFVEFKTGPGVHITLNTETIDRVERVSNGHGAIIWLRSGHSVMVRETYDEVAKALKGDQT